MGLKGEKEGESERGRWSPNERKRVRITTEALALEIRWGNRRAYNNINSTKRENWGKYQLSRKYNDFFANSPRVRSFEAFTRVLIDLKKRFNTRRFCIRSVSTSIQYQVLTECALLVLILPIDRALFTSGIYEGLLLFFSFLYARVGLFHILIRRKWITDLPICHSFFVFLLSYSVYFSSLQRNLSFVVISLKIYHD